MTSGQVLLVSHLLESKNDMIHPEPATEILPAKIKREQGAWAIAFIPGGEESKGPASEGIGTNRKLLLGELWWVSNTLTS